ncbi:ribonuclease HII [Alkaliphilus sp. B6464]|uniref:ribonuclease HII n=1 Tax=Alkaliphilus sp. B6464 TaxID=2731219 RepID=UPI001BA48F9F|nr:ribonuclease HII [Alkaliphilus sp. B6464]QUH21860.1 ribonuclease HII [Alkaliphilus sp. B6464]
MNFKVGIDEVGVSSIAGPMVAALVVLPENHGIDRLPIDSKNLSDNEIIELAKQIKEKAMYFKIKEISAEEVDKHGVSKSMRKLWNRLAKHITRSRQSKFKVNYIPEITIILDGNQKMDWIERIPKVTHITEVSADAKHDCVSAASIIAKDYCDQKLREIDRLYPQYNFKQHKGYPTTEHIVKIKEVGLCKEHRFKIASNVVKDFKEENREIHLSEEQVKEKLTNIYLLDTHYNNLIGEWERNFCKLQFLTAVKNKKSLSPKVQFIINEIESKCFNNLKKLYKKNANKVLEELKISTQVIHYNNSLDEKDKLNIIYKNKKLYNLTPWENNFIENNYSRLYLSNYEFSEKIKLYITKTYEKYCTTKAS